MDNFICNKCNHSFISKFSLNRHQQRQNKCNKITEFKCNKCNRCFIQKKNLIQHIENNNCRIIITKPIVNNNLTKKDNSNLSLSDILILNITNEEKLKLIKIINNKLIDQNIIDILNSNLPNNSKVTLLKSNNMASLNKIYNINNQKSDYINFTNINTKTDDINLISYIYLIQEREHVINNNNIYKFGRTTQIPDNKISRLTKYKRGSKVLLILRCLNDKVLEYESVIRKEFKKKFIPHIDGHEHFEGNHMTMMKIIYSVVIGDEEEILRIKP